MPGYRHFILSNTSTREEYTATGGGGGNFRSPPRPAQTTHGQNLVEAFAKARKLAERRLSQEPVRAGLQFIPLEFDESSEFEMKIERLENENRGIRIINAVERNGRKRFLVGVPDDQVEFLFAKFTQYRDDVPVGDKRPANEPLASGISNIESAELADYWTDAGGTLPSKDEVFWWEVWLEVTDIDIESEFRSLSATQNIQLSSYSVRFPERLVILAYTSFAAWEQFPGLLRFLAEFRRANTLAGEFRELSPSAQGEFVEELLQGQVSPRRTHRRCASSILASTAVTRCYEDHSMSLILTPGTSNGARVTTLAMAQKWRDSHSLARSMLCLRVRNQLNYCIAWNR